MLLYKDINIKKLKVIYIKIGPQILNFFFMEVLKEIFISLEISTHTLSVQVCKHFSG